MSMENPFASQESVKKSNPERMEPTEEKVFSELLLKHAQKMNEGNNGVIFELQQDGMRPEVQQFLEKAGVMNVGSERSVAKLLKLSEPGKLQREFGLQKAAHDLVHPLAVSEMGMYADIPNPRYYGRLKMSSAIDQFVQSHDLRVQTPELELVVMDRVEGTDLDTIMMREFLLMNPASDFFEKPEAIEGWSYNDLTEEAAMVVGLSLDMEKPMSKFTQQEWQQYSRFREMRDRKLDRLGFRLDARLIQAVMSSADVIDVNKNILWGDGNLRNVMIEGDYRPHAGGKAWMIDFGGSKTSDEVEAVSKYKQNSTAGLQKVNARFGA